MEDPQRELKLWLAEKVAPHGQAARLATAIGMSSDKITRSKELASPDPKKRRKIQEPEIRAIARHFRELPPGYEGADWLDNLPALDDAEPLASALRQARKARGRVMKEVGAAIGISGPAYAEWEAGREIPNPHQINEVAQFLAVDSDELRRGNVVSTNVEPLGDAVFVSGSTRLHMGPRDIEKLGVVAAGDDGDFEFNGQIAEFVPRPKGLMDRPGVFALQIISGSMYPAYSVNDIIYCDRLDPQIGDDVVIETFPEDGAKNGKAFVKRLKKRTMKTIVVEQFDPRKELTFDPYAIKHVWRVVPRNELLGY